MQPEALRIADFLEKRKVNFDETQNAANELRRLHQENEWLINELKTVHELAQKQREQAVIDKIQS